MTEGNYTVPVGVEKPIPIMFWEPAEFVLAITTIGLGMISNAWPLGLVAAGAILIWTRHLKRGTKRGAMQHFLWLLGLPLDPALDRYYPPSDRNDFFE